jgi:HlyD family secretion protein
MRTAWLWTAIVLLLIAGGSYGLYVYLKPASLPAQILYANGHVEGTEVKVAAEVAGRVVESRLVEGRTITAGDLLARLDDTDPRLNKARAEAEADALEQERERLKRELQVWRHHLRTAESDLARYQELKERGTVPPQRLEQAENAFREAQGRVAALEAGIGAIGKRITAARRELDLLVNQIDKTSISAPLDATILIKAVEPGEFVQPGQTVATLLDLRRAELKVFIPERDIAKVKLSALARVRVDAYPDRMFEARVARVDQAAQFTPRDIHMPEERVRLVFGVTLSLDNPDGVLKPGMPADAWILWQSAAGWPERLFVPE